MINRLFIFLFIFITSNTVYAQITINFSETPLAQALNEISESHDIIFSFSNEVVKGKSISLSLENSSLDELLVELATATQLNFKKISERQVIITVPKITYKVCGYINDAETNEPLPFSSIQLNGSTKGTIANAEGYFNLGLLEAGDSIKITFLGYEEKSIPAGEFNNTKCPEIQLIAESLSLPTVLILDYITAGVGKNIDGSIDFSSDELGILPGQTENDILRAIQMIPGINSPDETASGIQIRGGAADQNLVLWDNIRMYNTGHLFGMISAFNPNIINETKVVKGGANPKYGDRISGVIDIKSREDVPEKLAGGAGLNGTSADFFIEAPITKKVGLVLSGRRAYTDYIETPTYNALFEKVFQNTKIEAPSDEAPSDEAPSDEASLDEAPLEGEVEDDDFDEEEENEFEDVIRENNFFFYDASFKLIGEVSPKDKITASGILTQNTLNFEIANEEDILVDNLEISNEGLSVTWEGFKGKKWSHSLKGFYTNYTSSYDYTEQFNSVLEFNSIRRNAVQEYGADASLTYDINNTNYIDFGYQFTTNEVSYEVANLGEFEDAFREEDLVNNRTNAVFANYTFLPQNKGFVNIGVRALHYSVLEEVFVEPRLNIEYPIVDNLRLKGTAERRYQSISQLIEFEDTELRLGNSLWAHADGDDTPILKSTQFTAGILFSKNGWNIELDSYYKSIQGLTSLTNGFNNVSDDLFNGESQILGVDFLLKKKYKNFRTWLGYTFNDVQFTFPEIRPNSFSGNNDITHNFRVSNTYDLNNWQFSLGWFWRTGTPFTDANLNQEDIEFDAPNGERLPTYHRLDASILYTFHIKNKEHLRGQMGFSVLNIYNRQVPLSISYNIDEDSETEELELDVISQQSLGFTPNFSLRVWF